MSIYVATLTKDSIKAVAQASGRSEAELQTILESYKTYFGRDWVKIPIQMEEDNGPIPTPAESPEPTQ